MMCIHTLEFLQNRDRKDILSRTTLAIPVFHVYGHKPECQVCFVCFFMCMYAFKIHFIASLQSTTMQRSWTI